MKSALDLLGQVHRLGLDVFPGFHGLSLAQHEAAWNGVGSEKWAPALRAVSTSFFWRWQVAALVHDDEWEFFNDGTWQGWRDSNDRFRRNGLRIIREDVPWWRVVTRYRLYGWNEALCACLDTDASWHGWLAAYEAKQAEGPEESEP